HFIPSASPLFHFMKNRKNLVIVITGASSGIGLESAKLFARNGAKLALLARAADKLQAAEQAVRAENPDTAIFTRSLDVTDERAVETVFAEVAAALGPIDILINNAGTGFATDLSTCSTGDFRRIFETNVTGVFLCT